MDLYGFVKVLHILAVAAVIAGIVGRAFLRARLARIDDIQNAREFIEVEGHFDEWLVVRGSIATLITGILLAWLGHWPLVNAGTGPDVLHVAAPFSYRRERISGSRLNREHHLWNNRWKMGIQHIIEVNRNRETQEPWRQQGPYR
jgi:NADH:ubiquinone oxidoreductase subunit 5 (subunit L)/multisubunit Na+/H+ antiporter MnhA subunit